MAVREIRSSPSGPRVEVLVPPEVETPDPAKYLSETGEYTVPAGGGGAVSSVAGSDDLIPDTPQTGDVVLSAVGLLPRLGTRPMLGPLQMGGNSVLNCSDVNGVPITDSGSNALFLAQDGAYRNPAETVLGFDYEIASKAELALIAPPLAGVISAPAGRYLVTGNIDLTETAGISGSPTANDRVEFASGSFVRGAPGVPYSITGDVNNLQDGMIELNSSAGSSALFEDLRLFNAANGALLRVNGTATSRTVIQRCILDGGTGVDYSHGVAIGSLGDVELLSNYFKDGQGQIKLLGNSRLVRAVNCFSDGGERILWTASGVTVNTVQFHGHSSTLVGNSNFYVELAATIEMLICQNSDVKAQGNTFEILGAVTSCMISDNVFQNVDQFACFNGLVPDFQGGSPVSSFKYLRGNLWRNSANNSFFLLKETGIGTQSPP